MTAEQVAHQFHGPRGRKPPRHFRKTSLAEMLGVTACTDLGPEAILPVEIANRQRSAEADDRARRAAAKADRHEGIRNLLERGLKDP